VQTSSPTTGGSHWQGANIEHQIPDVLVRLDLPKAGMPLNHLMLPVPAVVSTNGRITFEYVNPVYAVRLRPDLLLAAVKAELK
jgi:hypothetical protein